MTEIVPTKYDEKVCNNNNNNHNKEVYDDDGVWGTYNGYQSEKNTVKQSVEFMLKDDVPLCFFYYIYLQFVIIVIIN